MYRSMIETQGLSSDVGQLMATLSGALHMLSQPAAVTHNPTAAATILLGSDPFVFSSACL